jgi:MauM/NapG family ferredoxin protein
MRLTRTRTISQAFFLGLFLWLLFKADFSRIENYSVSLFLEINPLHALATALSSKTLYSGLILSLFVIIPTIFLGRVFCGWVCPFGTLHHFVSRWFRPGKRDELLEANRYRPIFALKYYILVAFLVLAAFGVTQVGLLDPIALLTRSLATSVLPALGVLTGGYGLPERTFQAAWLLGGILVVLLLLNAVIPRFFCRVLCPLGALLGVISRFSLFHVHRPETQCSGCEQCLVNCQGAADPHASLRKSECFGCLDCREDCPTQVVSFSFLPPEDHVTALPDVSRRRLIQVGALSLASLPLLGASVRSDRLPDPLLIRPPGAEPEADFLAKCIKCGACMKVCPTNTIQPALFEGGLEGIWTPVMHYRLGYCEYNCTLCSEVCPTGALRAISLEEKLGQPPHDKPVRLGTAFLHRHRCLPWSMNTPCIVCEEVCPVSPKAIYLEPAEVVNAEGERIALQRPVVDPSRCIGCGLCEYKCPVYDQRAIRVSSVGESRSEVNVMVLDATSVD